MSMDINTTTITVDITDWRDRWVVRWEDMDGNRFRFFTKVGTLDSKSGYIEKDPPKGCHHRDYFETRKLDVSTKASMARLAIVRDYVTANGLVEKAQADLRAKEIAKIEAGRAYNTRAAKIGHGVELYNMLATLVQAQRRATSQHSLDGLADSAEALLAKIDAQIAAGHAEAEKEIAKL